MPLPPGRSINDADVAAIANVFWANVMALTFRKYLVLRVVYQ
jgi:hypothetical protein